MIFPSNRVRIVVATKPVDFRKGHGGLVAHVKNALCRGAIRPRNVGRFREWLRTTEDMPRLDMD